MYLPLPADCLWSAARREARHVPQRAALVQELCCVGIMFGCGSRLRGKRKGRQRVVMKAHQCTCPSTSGVCIAQCRWGCCAAVVLA